ncbi:MAG: hypothetical protein AAF497_12095, partial [Planctomycetota bacterium]
LSCNSLLAQTTEESAPAKSETNSSGEMSIAKKIEAFEKMMTGVTMAGSFTMLPPKSDDGEEQKSPKLFSDRYDIKKVKKMKKGDFWVITARIKYGDKDRRFPVPVEVKWAGNTPVITVDSVTIPGMGTFDARVLIKGKRYAGTWRHDDVVGHMFGMLEPIKVDEEKGE